MSRVPDGCLVPTAPLAEAVSAFLHNWNRDRPQTAGRFHGAGPEPVGPIRGAEWLSTESGVPEDTISRIVGLRSHGTELRIADALTTAIERPDLFCDGDPPTLPIYPNPSAPAVLRATCCGGSGFSAGSVSLNGSAAF